MKVCALISGGKDSCYNLMCSVSAGHEVVCLANLHPPPGKDELDSYMYQTVGHDAIELYSEAMALPLYRRVISGKPVLLESDYSPAVEDEVEDLFELLSDVKVKEGVEAVSVGAIFSDYQRVRVQNVCDRLGLKMLAYLWHKEQSMLMRAMIEDGVQAIIIKVAAMGLCPEKHLGLQLQDILPTLVDLHQKYGINVCGEGGEFETFVLDCPVFVKRIVLEESEVVIHSNDAFAPVGYLRLKKLRLEDKEPVPDLKKFLVSSKILCQTNE